MPFERITRYRILEALAIAAIAGSVAVRLERLGLGAFTNAAGVVDLIIRPFVMLVFLITSRVPKSTSTDLRAVAGVVLAFVAPLGFTTSGHEVPLVVGWLALAAGVFYSAFVLISYLMLGRSLSVFPASKKLVDRGPYRIVRHPLYAGYIMLGVCFVASFPTLGNVTCLLLMAVGLILRLKSEESILTASGLYDAYKRTLRTGIMEPVLSLPAVSVVMAAAMTWAFGGGEGFREPIRIQMAYPVLSLDPRIYDDWTSVFVGNHIFRRLLPDPNTPPEAALANGLELACSNHTFPARAPECKQQIIRLQIRRTTDCRGRVIRVGSVKHELQDILSAKPWILPGWSFCEANGDQLCLSGPSITDHERRLRSLYVRFGWSGADSDRGGEKIGSGPYCLKTKRKESDGTTSNAVLTPHPDFDGKLPPIRIYTSQSAKQPFDVALYGEEGLLAGRRRNIHTNTPLGYYLVTHQKYAGHATPWNAAEARAIIREHFLVHGLIQKNAGKFVKAFLPQGAANNGAEIEGGESLAEKGTLILPDYITDCKELSARLNEYFAKYPGIPANAECRDLISFQKDHVWPMTGDGHFDAFLSPLSPGAPAREAIRFQYFSPLSPESYTRDYPRPDELFYLVGAGPSWITVDGEKYCDVRANSMGLGNVFATDFVHCDDVAGQVAYAE